MKHYYLSLLFIILAIPPSYGIKKVDLDSVLGENNIILKTYKWVDRTFNSYDTAYVAGTGKHFNFKIKNDNWGDAYNFGIGKKTRIDMMSDIGCFIGASIGYRAVSVSYMIDVKNAFQKDSRSRSKVDFSFTCSRISFNVFYNQNNGETNITGYGIGKNINKSKHEFTGIRTENAGISAYYIFNHLKFSHAAAYSFSRIQKRSAGSFFLGASASTHIAELDFSSLPTIMKDSFEGKPLQYNFRYNDYSILFGYGYNYVFARKWLLGAMILPSMGLKYSHEGYIDGKQALFSVDSSAKLSVVYNHSRYFAGLVGQYNAFLYLGDNYSMVNLIGSLNVCLGVRF